MPLNELKSYIEANKHLPGIPTEKVVSHFVCKEYFFVHKINHYFIFINE